ncbi:AAA family ATPase [Phlyctema vagabunda]|uniref:AAA family ATPase n=1 Tax=Phlyctema vagabunda TaxID=108571 RepID=A0ABR4P8L8_9HELO
MKDYPPEDNEAPKMKEGNREPRNPFIGGEILDKSEVAPENEIGPETESIQDLFPSRGLSNFRAPISDQVSSYNEDVRVPVSGHNCDPIYNAHSQDCSLQPRRSTPPFPSNNVPELRSSQKSATDSLSSDIFAQLKLAADIIDRDDAPRRELQDRLRSLANLTKRLHTQHELLKASVEPQAPILTLHRVRCFTNNSTVVTTDLPVYSKDKFHGHEHLQGYVTISDISIYLERYTSSPFVAFRQYECGKCLQNPSSELNQASYSSKPQVAEQSLLRTSIRLLSPNLCVILNSFVNEQPHADLRFPKFDLNKEIVSPYLFFYHNREVFNAERDKQQSCSEDLRRFIDNIQDTMAAEYAEVDELFSRGLVTAQFVPYLFHPMTTLVTINSGTFRAYTQISKLQQRSFNTGNDSDMLWTVEAETWTYDGSFRKTSKLFNIKYGLPNDPTIPYMKISSLLIYPLHFASPAIDKPLRERGKKFWSCRTPRYVTYTGRDYSGNQVFTDSRFMVDMGTYQLLHPKENNAITDTVESNITLDMTDETELDDNFFMLLPPNVFAFHMQEKKWVDLHVELIRPIRWQKESFESLVVDSDTKELIIALITNKLEADKATDLMAGKGNGLIMLLHGGPGTGKTLTAESVAEIAERPLYRVTCGDIGTSAVDVEKASSYLETVLNLGKMWNCVVLLDEADVFLEQRTLADMERILILTSNRVGTFDEAFKSRIQLALHYENLTRDQRSKIWSQFIRRLAEIESGSVDTVNLAEHVDELAKLEMNGREIRNALTTARQLAAYKKAKMNFEHLKHVIKVAGKFERYLQEVMDGITDDELARDKGVR